MISVTQPRIFGTGLIALDLVIGADPETPVHCWAGGTCGNVLSILAWLGWDAYPVARMDGDAASERVCADMARWGVHFDWSTRVLLPRPRRSSFRRFDAGGMDAPGTGSPGLARVAASGFRPSERLRSARWRGSSRRWPDASVFFLDRLSRASLTLAAEASAHGAVIVFEPSSKATDKLMSEGFALAHVVKYADDRLAGFHGAMGEGFAPLLEVRTLGERGLRLSPSAPSAAFPTGCISRPFPRRDLPTPAAPATGARPASSPRPLSTDREGLHRAGASGVRAALRYGQALAAWNCCFEGARGGMYAVTRDAFETQIADLQNGRLEAIDEEPDGGKSTHVVTCPACPPE